MSRGRGGSVSCSVQVRVILVFMIPGRYILQNTYAYGGKYEERERKKEKIALKTR